MKHKLLTILLMLVSLLSLPSCDSKDAQLKKYIEDYDKACPSTMDCGEITRARYDASDKAVQLYITISDEYMTIDDVTEYESIVAQSMILSFSQDGSSELFELMAAAGAKLEMIFHSVSTGDSHTITIDNDQIKKALDSDMDDEASDAQILQNTINIEKGKCPYSIDEGFDIVDVSDEGTDIVYWCRVDEDIYEMEGIEEIQDDIKQGIGKSLGDTGTSFIELAVSAGKGLCYVFCGSESGDSVEICFSTDELRQL